MKFLKWTAVAVIFAVAFAIFGFYGVLTAVGIGCVVHLILEGSG